MSAVGQSSQICHRCGYRSSSEQEHHCPHDGTHLVDAGEHAKSPRDLFLGTLLGGRYPILAIIGAGGMGAVYRSVQPHLEREVAIKVILPTSGMNVEDARQRFLREARAIARLSHPAVVTLHDFGVEPDGTTYMVMECVHGRTLRCVFEEGGFTTRQLVTVACSVLEALDHAHGLGIVHRDIKPENIMLEQGRGSARKLVVKVLDFGLVKMMGGGVRLTQTGMLNGTPAYMSPEQAMGSAIDARSDLYSLATVLYEGLHGSIPFRSENVLLQLMQRINEDPPPLPVAAHVPPALAALVARGLARRPEERFASAQEMLDALSALDLGPAADLPLPPVRPIVPRRATAEPELPPQPGSRPGTSPGTRSAPDSLDAAESATGAAVASTDSLVHAATWTAAGRTAMGSAAGRMADDDGSHPTLAVPGLSGQPAAGSSPAPTGTRDDPAVSPVGSAPDRATLPGSQPRYGAPGSAAAPPAAAGQPSAPAARPAGGARTDGAALDPARPPGPPRPSNPRSFAQGADEPPTSPGAGVEQASPARSPVGDGAAAAPGRRRWRLGLPLAAAITGLLILAGFLAVLRPRLDVAPAAGPATAPVAAAAAPVTARPEGQTTPAGQPAAEAVAVPAEPVQPPAAAGIPGVALPAPAGPSPAADAPPGEPTGATSPVGPAMAPAEPTTPPTRGAARSAPPAGAASAAAAKPVGAAARSAGRPPRPARDQRLDALSTPPAAAAPGQPLAARPAAAASPTSPAQAPALPPTASAPAPATPAPAPAGAPPTGTAAAPAPSSWPAPAQVPSPSPPPPAPNRPQPTNTFHALDSDPPGASVVRNGKLLGVTPLMVGAPYQPGASYHYELTLPGHHPAGVTLPLNGGVMQQKIRLQQL